MEYWENRLKKQKGDNYQENIALSKLIHLLETKSPYVHGLGTWQTCCEKWENWSDQLKREDLIKAVNRTVAKLEKEAQDKEDLKKLPQIKEENKRLEKELEQERKIHTDSMKAMDNFYQQNPPEEEHKLNNILKNFEQDYLKLEIENRNYKKKIEELENSLSTLLKISEQELREKTEIIEQTTQIIQPSKK